MFLKTKFLPSNSTLASYQTARSRVASLVISLKLSFSDTTVYRRWQVKGNTCEISVFTSGEIHETYLVR